MDTPNSTSPKRQGVKSPAPRWGGKVGLTAAVMLQSSRRRQNQRRVYSFTPRNLSALPITLTEESAIAAAATIGDRTRPNIG
jgi:hypothetical protein